jgi:hypothetical protein
MNRYAYVGNAPTSFTDPTGEVAEVVGACAAYWEICGGAFIATIGSFFGGGDGPSTTELLWRYVTRARRLAPTIGLSGEEIDGARRLRDKLPHAHRIFEIAKALEERGEDSVFRGSSRSSQGDRPAVPREVPSPGPPVLEPRADILIEGQLEPGGRFVTTVGEKTDLIGVSVKAKAVGERAAEVDIFVDAEGVLVLDTATPVQVPPDAAASTGIITAPSGGLAVFGVEVRAHPWGGPVAVTIRGYRRVVAGLP